MSSKSMKLIMESWRKYSTVSESQQGFEELTEKVASLEEGGLSKALAIGGALAAMGSSPPAEAGGISGIGGPQQANQATVDVAGDLALDKSPNMGGDKQAFEDANAMADWIVSQPSDVDDGQLINMFQVDHSDWSQDKTYDAYTVLNKAIDFVQSQGIQKVKASLEAPAEPEPPSASGASEYESGDKELMQKMLDAQQQAKELAAKRASQRK